MRYVLLAVCVGVIVARAALPELRFDNISLLLLVLVVIILLIPELPALMGRIRKLRVGDFEIELDEKLTELAAKTDTVEAAVGEQAAVLSPDRLMESKFAIATGIDSEVTKLMELPNPEAALVLIAAQIEKTIRILASETDLPELRYPRPFRQVLRVLVEKQLLNPDIFPLFQDFWAIRNRVVHGRHFEVSEGRLYELVELGFRILRLLAITRIRLEDSAEN